MSVVTRQQLAEHIVSSAKSFVKDELAYLAVTSKVELPLRDRLAWSLHSALTPRYVVAREWQRIDMAVLEGANPSKPLALIEAKAMYLFDGADPGKKGLFLGYMTEDALKCRQYGGAGVYLIAYATHVQGSPPKALDKIVKYNGLARRAIALHGSHDAVADSGRSRLHEGLAELGLIEHGVLPAGKALGFEVTVDWWVIEPI